VSFHYYFIFFWDDFSSRVFQYLFNGSLASGIFSAFKKGHLGGKDTLAATKTSTRCCSGWAKKPFLLIACRWTNKKLCCINKSGDSSLIGLDLLERRVTGVGD
jgi:hypothetical protein